MGIKPTKVVSTLRLLALLAVFGQLVSCKGTDNDRAKKVINADFATRVVELPAEYFSVFADSADMSSEMLEAMKFLYAYMPLPDITDYSGEYFRDNVAVTLKAREEMAWGKTVPDREFRHFVLPIRVNNENLDNHRAVFYEELKDRVAGMTMEEAILEVNHWCHEKATYQPSDSRTHSPLATVSSAIGRCGEESTFTVAALRSIGIPARQVYTPRWAHTDDNHAWVEAWADGQWHFLGACEPEAVLDLGWFNAPAARGMLMNTRALGRYDGPEEKLLCTDKYTDINVTNNYADVDTVTVIVINPNGHPVEGAKVDFRLYNYAEFYPIASKITDAYGKAKLVAGLGDLIVWASYYGVYDMEKVTVGKDKKKTIVLSREKNDKTDKSEKNDKNLTEDTQNTQNSQNTQNNTSPSSIPSSPFSSDMTIVPPKAVDASVEVPEELAALNDRRKAYEDSIRGAYSATFKDESRGNYTAIKAFLDSVGPQKQALANKMLKALSVKDLSDVSTEILLDAFNVMPTPNSVGSEKSECYSEDFFVENVLCPRVYTEFLTPNRGALINSLTDNFGQDQLNTFSAQPQHWAQWVRDNIATDKTWEPSRVIMDPLSVYKLRHTNDLSRDVFFVASARAMGIPARYEGITGKAQYYHQGSWCDLLSSEINQQAPTGKLLLTYDKAKAAVVDDPKYYVHFTISKVVDGRPQLLEYPEEATWKTDFSKPQEMEEGTYLLVTGQRLADGSVLTRTDIFEIKQGQTITIPLVVRQDGEGIKVIGNFDSERLYLPLNVNKANDNENTENTVITLAEAEKSLLSSTGRGYYVLGILGGTDEPSVHAMRDLLDSDMQKVLSESGVPVVLLFTTEDAAGKCEFTLALGEWTNLGIDKDSKIKNSIKENLNLNGKLPVFIIADTFNRVVYVSEGYNINLGQQIKDTVARL